MIKPDTGFNTDYMAYCNATFNGCSGMDCTKANSSSGTFGFGFIIVACGWTDGRTPGLALNLFFDNQTTVPGFYIKNESVAVPGEENMYIDITVIRKDSGIVFAVSEDM